MEEVLIFVSSPKEVDEERDALEEACGDINDSIGGERRLKTFYWEEDVISQIGPGPQEVVNSQTPECDIYLGILSTHFGTETGEYGSGTEKEFRDALKRCEETDEPWILFYFDDDVKPGSKVSRVEQYLNVCRFREELDGLGITRGYKGVRDPKGFLRRVARDLRLYLKRLEFSEARPKSRRPRSTAVEPGVPMAYREWLEKRYNNVELPGLRLGEWQSIRLDHVYVPLSEAVRGRSKARDRRKDASKERSFRPLLELLDRESIYLSGSAGSGKSTFCRWVSKLTLSGSMPASELQVPAGYVEEFPDWLANRLPILVELRGFWPFLPKDPELRELTSAQFEQSFAAWLQDVRPRALEWPLVESHLHQGTALLILDGMDEVPPIDGERHPRQLLLSGLYEALPQLVDAGNRILITSRTSSLTEREAALLSIRKVAIEDLAGPARDLLVRRWFHLLSDDASEGEVKARELIEEIDARPELGPLIRTPLLLTAICIVSSQDKERRLPQDKYGLYDRLVDAVLHSRFPQSDIDRVRSRLGVVALGMHTGIGLDEERTAPLAVATNSEIERMIQADHARSRRSEAGYRGAARVRRQLLSMSGLLLPRGETKAAFYHNSFQDFFAALRMGTRTDDRLFEDFIQRAPTPEWRQTLAFRFDALLASRMSPERSIRLLGKLIDAIRPEEAGLQLVVADCFQTLIGHGIRLEKNVEDKFRNYCLAAIDNRLALPDRVELLLALGRIGDTRIGPDLRDPATYVRIEAGDYSLGEGLDAFHLEEPFLMARYPVTNLQFERFIRDGGYGKRWLWSDEGKEWLEERKVVEHRYRCDVRFNAPNQPVVGVAYWEAEAFAKWVGGRLPTEREWIAAACGSERWREYPWGNRWKLGICNCWESGLRTTSPVGLFPDSRSWIYELEDMAGNVLEWCSDESGGAVRALRGGSWRLNRAGSRCSYRGRNFAEVRDKDIGFRLLRSDT